MAHTFYINSTKKNGRAPAYFMVRIGNKLVKINSGVNAEIEDLNTIKKSKSAKSLPKDLRTIKNDIDLASDIIDRCIANGMTSGKEIGAKVRDIMSADTDKAIIQKTNHVLGYLRGFITDMENGSIRRNADDTHKLSDGTIDIYKQLLQHLENYDGITEETTFDALDGGWIRRFRGYMLNSFMPATVKSYFSVFGRLCRYAYTEDNVHKNKYLLTGFRTKVPKEENGDAKCRVALSQQIWDALYNMQGLKGQMKVVRDLIFWGYCSFNRHSDYSRVTKKMFNFDKGYPTLRMQQKKTGIWVTVPVYDVRGQKILSEYNYHFPMIHRAMVTRYFKDLLHMLVEQQKAIMGDNTQSDIAKVKAESIYKELTKEHKTLLTQREKNAEKEGRLTFKHDEEDAKFVWKQTWEMESTHTCRISAITNARRAKILSDKQITSMTGQKSFAVFDHYDTRDGDELAESIVEDMKRGTPNMRIA